eukprot:s2320_g13.t1
MRNLFSAFSCIFLRHASQNSSNLKRMEKDGPDACLLDFFSRKIFQLPDTCFLSRVAGLRPASAEQNMLSMRFTAVWDVQKGGCDHESLEKVPLMWLQEL